MLSLRSWATAFFLPAFLLGKEVVGQEAATFSLELQPIYAAMNGSTINCDKACLLIQQAIGHQKAYHGTPPDGFKEAYFSLQQSEADPVCVLVPETAQDVAQAITIVKDQDCQFAVKSGGHGTFAGASNIQDGLVFDLRKLNTVEISEDETMVSVGTGNRWIDVYSILDEKRLTVVGGRIASVGVGGFLLGGGISFHSRKYGWAVDNVRNFEIVLANGTIANVNAHNHPDLFWALHGSGGNFGIVTRFDLEAYRQDLIWGGTDIIALSDVPSRRAALGLQDPFEWTFQSATIKLGGLLQRVLCYVVGCSHSKDCIESFVNMSEQNDTNAHVYMFFAWVPFLRMFGVGKTYAYLEPVAKPRAFTNMTALKSFYSSGRLGTMSDFARETDSYIQTMQRQYWISATFKVDAELISKLWDIFLEEINNIKNMPNCQPSSNYQLITKDDIALSNKKGVNPMGLKEEDGPLFLFSVTISYTDAKDDEKIKAVSQSIMSRASALAKEMGLFHPFVYKNYAAGETDVYAGYGVENRQKLRDIQKKYDPEDVFSRLLSGPHKI